MNNKYIHNKTKNKCDMSLPATRSIGGLSGWSSICRATYCPSKCAYHHPLLPPPCVLSCCPAAEERTKGIRKYLWDDSTICCFNGVLGVFAAGKHNRYRSLKISLSGFAIFL